MKNLIMLMAAVAVLGGCAMKTKVLDAAAVSMTHYNLKEGESLQETGAVTGEFCTDMQNGKGTVGLFDEAIKNAQTQSGVDFILNASFWSTGKCVSVEGTGAKIVGSSGGGSSTPAPAKKTKKK